MPSINALEQLVHERMVILGLSRGLIGQRLSPHNPSKALRRLDDFIANGQWPSDDLAERLAGVLELPSAELITAARVTWDANAARTDAEYRARFQPHAVWTTVRNRPSSVAIAGFINAPAKRILLFPANLPSEDFIDYCLEHVPEGVPLYGPITGFVINYTPAHAVRFNLNGNALETMNHAVQVGAACIKV